MSLTPEQIAEGWIEWSGGECPIKDDRTKAEIKNWFWETQRPSRQDSPPSTWSWRNIKAYRITEAHGADAEPARPTPFPASYDDLVFDADGWSQTIIVDGKRPEWLRDDDECTMTASAVYGWRWKDSFISQVAIRVRRRKPKRETVQCWVKPTLRGGGTFITFDATIDLIDGEPDPSTLKIGGEA